jgi:hypothetical protein
MIEIVAKIPIHIKYLLFKFKWVLVFNYLSYLVHASNNNHEDKDIIEKHLSTRFKIIINFKNLYLFTVNV